MLGRARAARARVPGTLRVMTAAAAYAALQRTPRQRQALAPAVLATLEAQADAALAGMPAARLAMLRASAERIRRAQLDMGELLRPYDDCGACERLGGRARGGACCGCMVAQLFVPLDGLYRRLLGERSPGWPLAGREALQCGLWRDASCALPAGTRPLICVGFYCSALRDRLARDGVWAKLGPCYAELRAAQREIEFRFNLHRRFRGQAGPATIRDGTMGLLWDRMSRLFTAFDQIGSDPRPEGVDALQLVPQAVPASGAGDDRHQAAAGEEPDLGG